MSVWGAVTLRAFGIAGLALAWAAVAASAHDMKAPRISTSPVEWSAVATELAAVEPLAAGAHGNDGARLADMLAALNAATGEYIPGAATSPVPVILPIDTAGYLRARAVRKQDTPDAVVAPDEHLNGFTRVAFFQSGPAGFDAVVVAHPKLWANSDISFGDPVYVHIGGSALLYEVDPPAGMVGWPVKGLDEFPGIRRMFLENYLRYTFVRYGVPYVVAIECHEGGSRYRRISCRDANKVAVRFLKTLQVVGGAPAQPSEHTDSARRSEQTNDLERSEEMTEALHTEKANGRPRSESAGGHQVHVDTIERPAAVSSVFTFHSPGKLLLGTGFKGKSGVADYTVYSKIRFPISEAPAFANSQSFMNWGNCEATGRLSAGMRGRTAAYRCRVNGQPLISDESAADNYSYPWRDNFCEHRFFFVGQCPGGLGHQGQDIRPASCKQRREGANRCEPYQHDVVAVRDGAVLRAPGQEALYIVTNAPDERVRFRYLHMNPTQFDADGMVSGRLVREGEVIGKVGNYFKKERATSYHLHFDVQVPTRYGWVFVNPYMTLVAAYERLIRARGQEIVETAEAPAPPAPPASAEAPAGPAAKPTETAVLSPPNGDSGILRNERTDGPITTSLPAVAGSDAGEHKLEPGTSPKHLSRLRAMGGSVSHAGARERHLRRHLHAGHGQHQARHGGL